jgi:dihydrofolate reductase
VKAALAEAWDLEKSLGGAEVFVIGGAAIYEAALSEVDYAYLTQVYAEPDGDARMPAGWLEGFQRVRAGDRQPAHDRQPAYSFEEYERT